MTLSKTLQARLVVEDPHTAKEAWDLIALIFNDNKRSRSIALKAELRSMNLGYLSIDDYFRKIESIVTILTSRGSPISNDDGVTIALEGLPDKYDNTSVTSIDYNSSSYMVLLANFGASARRPNVATDKVEHLKVKDHWTLNWPNNVPLFGYKYSISVFQCK
ncbi:hybrid signal transduction histidine kinase M [Tanacetum coccineum]|uniref:Hybrid signal transduction histidine kinase M n=1 Tax=Tanacetum coccineum TaxID=301880 RepID=A0ABQ4Y0R7_9ASTR